MRCRTQVGTEVAADALHVATVVDQAGRILGGQVFPADPPADGGWLCRPADVG